MLWFVCSCIWSLLLWRKVVSARLLGSALLLGAKTHCVLGLSQVTLKPGPGDFFANGRRGAYLHWRHPPTVMAT